MQKILYIIIVPLTIYAFYKIYKDFTKNKEENKDFTKNKEENKEIKYFVNIYEVEDESENKNYLEKFNKKRVYKYKATTGSYYCLESEYRESLYGYNIKPVVDGTVREYLKWGPTPNKRVIIITDEWISDIEIETNVNPNTLIFEITKKN